MYVVCVYADLVRGSKNPEPCVPTTERTWLPGLHRDVCWPGGSNELPCDTVFYQLQGAHEAATRMWEWPTPQEDRRTLIFMERKNEAHG